MKHGDYRSSRRRDPEYAQVEERLKPLLDLADDVLRLRLGQGWTQSELARKVGTRQANISRLESGLANPTLGFLQRVSNVLGEELVVRLVPRDAEPTRVAARAEVYVDTSQVGGESAGCFELATGHETFSGGVVDRSASGSPLPA